MAQDYKEHLLGKIDFNGNAYLGLGRAIAIGSCHWSSKSKTAKLPLPVDFSPTDFSVICGREKACYQSEGNKRFRATVKMFLSEYDDAKGKQEKSQVVTKVYNLIRQASPEGAFVCFERERYFEVSERIAREKIGALFREYLHDKYKSSSRSKQARKLSISKTGKYPTTISKEECKQGMEETAMTAVQSSYVASSHGSSDAFFATTIRKNFASFYDVDDSNVKHYIELVDIGLSGGEGLLLHAETKDIFEKEFSLEMV